MLRTYHRWQRGGLPAHSHQASSAAPSALCQEWLIWVESGRTHGLARTAESGGKEPFALPELR